MMEISVGPDTKRIDVKDGKLAYSLTDFTNEQSMLSTRLISEAGAILTDSEMFKTGKVLMGPNGPFVSYMKTEDTMCYQTLSGVLQNVSYESATHQSFGVCGPYDFPEVNHTGVFVICSASQDKPTYIVGLGRHKGTGEEFSFIVNLTKALGQ